MPKEEEIDHSHEIGMLKSEVHTLNTLVSKLFEKFDAYVEKTQPKPMGPATYIGIALSIMTIFALLGGSVMYMTNSANAPVVAQMAQMTQVLSTIQNSTIQNAGQTQLLNKELSGIEKSVDSNEETLRWIIFTENLPKQITETQGRLNTLEMQMNRLVNGIHNKGIIK
jgi:septal ring factor EnvC (AmiA/AmiB activator)